MEQTVEIKLNLSQARSLYNIATAIALQGNTTLIKDYTNIKEQLQEVAQFIQVSI